MRPRAAALPVLCLILAGACRSTGAVPRPFPSPGGSRPPTGSQMPPDAAFEPTAADEGPYPLGTPVTGSEPLEVGRAVSELALAFLGVRYRNGGDDPAGGFDCSGFVHYVFTQQGLMVPRRVEDQYRAGRQVDTPDARAGDLVFFNTTGVSPSHVGILLGGEQFVHAPSTTGEVRVERLTTRYWAGRFVGIRRLE